METNELAFLFFSFYAVLTASFLYFSNNKHKRVEAAGMARTRLKNLLNSEQTESTLVKPTAKKTEMKGGGGNMANPETHFNYLSKVNSYFDDYSRWSFVVISALSEIDTKEILEFSDSEVFNEESNTNWEDFFNPPDFEKEHVKFCTGSFSRVEAKNLIAHWLRHHSKEAHGVLWEAHEHIEKVWPFDDDFATRANTLSKSAENISKLFGEKSEHDLDKKISPWSYLPGIQSAVLLYNCLRDAAPFKTFFQHLLTLSKCTPASRRDNEMLTDYKAIPIMESPIENGSIAQPVETAMQTFGLFDTLQDIQTAAAPLTQLVPPTQVVPQAQAVPAPAQVVPQAQAVPAPAQDEWGVDFDGDFRVNLWEVGDALASMGNYLNSHGWAYGEPSAVQPANNSSGKEIRLGRGKKAITISTTGNHDALLRYNKDAYYALAVHFLAREFKGIIFS